MDWNLCLYLCPYLSAPLGTSTRLINPTEFFNQLIEKHLFFWAKEALRDFSQQQHPMKPRCFNLDFCWDNVVEFNSMIQKGFGDDSNQITRLWDWIKNQTSIYTVENTVEKPHMLSWPIKVVHILRSLSSLRLPTSHLCIYIYININPLNSIQIIQNEEVFVSNDQRQSFSHRSVLWYVSVPLISYHLGPLVSAMAPLSRPNSSAASERHQRR